MNSDCLIFSISGRFSGMTEVLRPAIPTALRNCSLSGFFLSSLASLDGFHVTVSVSHSELSLLIEKMSLSHSPFTSRVFNFTERLATRSSSLVD